MRLSKGWTLGVCLLMALVFGAFAIAQETTAGLQGTVKDPQGAVVAKAVVEVTSPALIGVKKLETDNSGYYRFANLPPGDYTITVTAPGFRTLKQSGISLDVGKLPTINLALQVGGTEQTVEVSSEAPVIDVTTTRTQTNVTEDLINDAPTGRTFQSVIQFAPGARNEPLQGASNGGNGYQIAGASQNESSYLVEGQDTGSIINGNTNASVPVDFIQEVQVKTSGVEAEHAGSLGGVINVITKRGGNSWHGSVFTSYESAGFDSAPRPSLRQDPQSAIVGLFDPPAQLYNAKKDKYSIWVPGGDIGGPIIKDRLWFFLGTSPTFTSRTRKVDFGSTLGNQYFTQDNKDLYTTARVDALISNRIRVFTSWLYQYQREEGAVLPNADDVNGLLNSSVNSPLTSFEHGYGWTAPNQTVNVGMDYTLTPSLVATTRYGYFYANYHDFGYPTTPVYRWAANGAPDANGNVVTDLQGNELPSSLERPYWSITGGLQSAYAFNVERHDQFTQDIAWFKKGFLGTHNIKAGYLMNHVMNNVNEAYTGPYVRLYPGSSSFYTFAGQAGAQNCPTIEAYNLANYGNPGGTASKCTGLYGYLRVRDYSTFGKASSTNHGLYVQDAWTIGKGVTVNAGIRFDKEYLPAYPYSSGFNGNPINFSWGDKAAPRIGAAWDVLQNGKMKLFGSYGVFYDVMKLNLAIGSFGGQYWHDCSYALYTGDYSSIIPVVSGLHYCQGSGDANFAGGTVPAGITFIENIDFRSSEGVDPNLKPYRQHESTFGGDYQLAKNWALEVRWDRRRLDHAIEDAGILDQYGNENFSIVNPGEGIDATVPGCAGCPPNVKARRDYDGVEFRLTKSLGSNWYGEFSYTYSKLQGNYAGLTNTDLSDGGTGGRTDPNNNRAFDEPYFEYNAYGKPSDGLLATDRPHTFKAYGYYRLPWRRSITTLGLFQQVYSGTPLSSYMDVGEAGGYPVYTEGRGKWVPISLDSTGNWVFGTPGLKRTPIYSQTDLRLAQDFKVNRNNEREVLGFSADVTNLFNQSSVVAYYSQMNSGQAGQAIQPGGSFDYASLMSPYDWKNLVNTYDNGSGMPPGEVLDSRYGKPMYFQGSRTIRLKLHFDF